MIPDGLLEGLAVARQCSVRRRTYTTHPPTLHVMTDAPGACRKGQEVTMIESVITLVAGFVLGYAVRSYVSHRRRLRTKKQ